MLMGLEKIQFYHPSCKSLRPEATEKRGSSCRKIAQFEEAGTEMTRRERGRDSHVPREIVPVVTQGQKGDGMKQWARWE